jgi:hypothetical protein
LTEFHVDEIEQIRTDTPFNLKDLRIYDQSDMMKIDEQSSFANYEIIDSNSRKILDHFLFVLHFNNTADVDQISNQVQIINDLIEKSPFITMHNKDQSVRLKSKSEYSVQAFDSVNAMINNSDYFQTLCNVLNSSFEEQLKRTAMDTIWGGKVQIQVLSI